MHMSHKLITFKRLSDETGVSYRTMLAWNKSRPELMNYIRDLQIGCSKTDVLDEEIARLKSKLNHINKYSGE